MKTIDRDLLIRKYIDTDIAKFNNSDVKIVLENLKQNILKMPTEDRPQGEWIEVDDSLISCKCSICGWESHMHEDDVYGMPYCPNCGACMKGADDNE